MLDVSKERHLGFLRASHKFLQEKVLLLEKELEQARQVKRADDELCQTLSEELLVLRRKFFGDTARERHPNKDHPKKNKRRKPQNELLLHNKRPLGELPDPVSELDSEEIIHRLDDEAAEDAGRTACACGEGHLGALSGAFEESTEVTVSERRYILRRHKRQKYKCGACGKIVAAKGEPKLKDGGAFSVHMAAQVADDKYHRHVPLNRQSEIMQERGLVVTSRTLYGLLEHLMALLGDEKLRRRILLEIKGEKWVHLDESPMGLMVPKSHGYVWSISNARGAYYQYETTRSGGVAREMLKEYGGIVMVDAYSGYDFLEKVPHIVLVLCWAHVRRKFFDAIPHYPKADAVVDLIDKIYEVDRDASDFDDLLKARQNDSKELVGLIASWIEAQSGRYLESSTIGKAISYATDHWPRLTRFLDNAHIPLDNNTGERAQRQPVMGRNNFFGFRTINGADVGMFYYTLVSTCRALTLSPKAYLLEMGLRAARGQETLTPFEYGQEIQGRLKAGEEMANIFAALRQ